MSSPVVPQNAVWRRSSRSTAQGNECVEVATFVGLVAVRDSKAPEGPVLVVQPSAFRLLTEDIRHGRYDN